MKSEISSKENLEKNNCLVAFIIDRCYLKELIKLTKENRCLVVIV